MARKDPQARKEYMKEWRQKNKASQREYMDAWRQKNPDKIKTYINNRESKPDYKKRQKEGNLRRNYGLTLEDFNALLNKQNCACAICKVGLTFNTANVDHCHSTGKVRGILCRKCNTALGQLGDNEAGLMLAVQYLRGFS